MTKVKSPKPIAILISDIHYNQKTLLLADASVRQAITKANHLGVPLVVAGDLHDSKANMRAECVNAMIETFKLAKEQPYVIIGNHDRLNEKTPDHALHFLAPYTTLVSSARTLRSASDVILLPYSHDARQYISTLSGIKKSQTIICHQGIEGSNMGDYIQDKSAIRPEDVAGRRVISGHYHARQTIQLPDGGSWDYIGNPYTLGFGEANDPEKGYQILMADGSLTFVPTFLRRHKRFEMEVLHLCSVAKEVRPGDIVWVRISGPISRLSTLSRATVADKLELTGAFRLDLIPDEVRVDTQSGHENTQAGQDEILDSLIDRLTNTSEDHKARLKGLWKDLNEKT